MTQSKQWKVLAISNCEDDDERVVTVYQTRSGAPVELDKLRDFCRSKLASYKIPHSVICLEKVKRSPAGKPDYPWTRQAA